MLATDGFESFVIFLYAHNKIEWTTGDRSSGENGLGGREAIAGINVGDRVTHVTIPGSMTPEIINIDETSNVGTPGVWMFQVGEGTVKLPVLLTISNGPRASAFMPGRAHVLIVYLLRTTYLIGRKSNSPALLVRPLKSKVYDKNLTLTIQMNLCRFLKKLI